MGAKTVHCHGLPAVVEPISGDLNQSTRLVVGEIALTCENNLKIVLAVVPGCPRLLHGWLSGTVCTAASSG